MAAKSQASKDIADLKAELARLIGMSLELTGVLRDVGISVEWVEDERGRGKWSIRDCRSRPDPSKPGDPWDQGKTYVCGTCQFYLEKAPGFGRCKGRGPTHRGYPAIYAHESPCRWHKLKTSKA